MATSRAGIKDEVHAAVSRADGAADEGVKGPDPKWWGPKARRPHRNSRRERAIGDKVKGPDPAVWGEERS